MTVRMSSARRSQMITEAQELARQRATQWRVCLRDNEGNALTGWIVIDAPDEETALNRACDVLDCRRSHVMAPTRARPLLKSSEWRDIYAEVAKEMGLA